MDWAQIVGAAAMAYGTLMLLLVLGLLFRRRRNGNDD